MRRLSVRRSGPGETLALATLGMGLGFLAGFLARGLVGDVGPERLRQVLQGRSPKRAPTRARAAADRILSAFQGDPELRAAGLDVLRVRGGGMELHGWVADRRARGRAVRLAGDAAPGHQITNRLRVHGEDDAPQPPEPHDLERRPA